MRGCNRSESWINKGENGEATYQITVTPSAAGLSELSIIDNMGTNQTLKDGKITVWRNYTDQKEIAVTTDSEGKFNLDLKGLYGDVHLGDSYMLMYTTVLEESSVPATNKVQAVWKGGSGEHVGTEKSAGLTTPVSKKVTSKSGTLNSALTQTAVVCNDGEERDFYTYDFTIEVGDGTNDVQGYSVADTMDKMKIPGTGAVTLDVVDTATGTVIDTITVNGGDTGFTYTFPTGSSLTSKYTISYQGTTYDLDTSYNGSQYVTNKVVTTHKDGKQETTYTNDSVDYKGPSSTPDPTPEILKSVDHVDEANSTIYWKIHVTVPTGKTYTEAMLSELYSLYGDTDYEIWNESSLKKNTILWSELQVLDETDTAMASGTYTVDTANKNIYFHNLDHDVTVIVATKYNAGFESVGASGLHFSNKAGFYPNKDETWIGYYGTASTMYSKDYGISKDVLPSLYGADDTGYNAETGVVFWRIKAVYQNGTTAVIQDYLPAGTELYENVPYNGGIGYGDEWAQNNAFAAGAVTVTDVTDSSSPYYGRKLLTITMPVDAASGTNGVYVKYGTTITDSSAWTEKAFTNYAELYDNTDTLRGNVTKTTNVKRKSLEKTSSLISNDTIEYTVKINVEGVKYTSGPTLTVEDSLPGGVTLLTNAYAGKAVQFTHGDGTACAEATYVIGTDILDLVVPDGEYIIAKFRVQVKNLGEQTITNKVQFKGTIPAEGEDSKTFTIASHSGSISANKGTISITKSDIENGTKLEGVVFEIYSVNYNSSTGLVDMGSVSGPITTMTTDASGYAKASGLVVAPSGSMPTLYYWVEKTPNPGYEEDYQPHYFFLYEEGANPGERAEQMSALVEKIVGNAENGITSVDYAPESIAGKIVTNQKKVTPVSVKIGGTKALANGTLYDGRYTFHMVQGMDAEAVTVPSDVTNAGSGFTFEEITFKKAGTYTFTVTEVAGSDSGITYSAKNYPIKIVIKETDGVLSVQEIIYNSGSKPSLTLSGGVYRLPEDETKSGETASFVNVVTSEKRNISVTKVWDDADDADGKRPTYVEVQLYADGVLYDTKNLNSSNSWTYTWNNLERKSGGTDILYTLTETPVTDYDAPVVTGNEDTGFTVTNTYHYETTQKEVEKVWDDSDNADNLRPDSVTVHLKADGVVVDTVVLKSSNNWKHTFTDLAVKSHGSAITYSVEEESVAYYTASYATSGDKFTVTNKHDFEKTTYTVNKVWNDAGKTAKRGKYTVTLYANGVQYGLPVELEADTLSYTWNDLPKKSGGVDITYTVQETGVPTGYVASVAGNTITNTLVTSIQVDKKWKNGLGATVPADSDVTLQLYRGKREVIYGTTTWTEVSALEEGETYIFVQGGNKGLTRSEYTSTYDLKAVDVDNPATEFQWIYTSGQLKWAGAANNYLYYNGSININADSNWDYSKTLVTYTSDKKLKTVNALSQVGYVGSNPYYVVDESSAYTFTVYKSVTPAPTYGTVTGIETVGTPATLEKAAGTYTFNNLPTFVIEGGKEYQYVYYVVETDAAEKGYTATYSNDAESPIADGTITVTNKVSVTTHSVSISKKAVSGVTELPGASLAIYKASDMKIDGTPNVGAVAVEAWPSSDTEHVVSLPSNIYALVEVSAPDGYQKADNIIFTVANDGTVTSTTPGAVSGTTVTMRDAKLAKASLALNGTKALTSGTPATGDYSFTITAVDAEGNPLTGTSAYTKTVTNTLGNITFDTFEYEKTGTYYYKIVEVTGSVPTITYDNAVYIAKVVVTAGTTKYETSLTYEKNGASATGVTFTNAVALPTSWTPVATKKMDGAAPADGTFAFTIQQMESDFTTAKGSATEKSNVAGNVTFDTVNYDTPGIYYYAVKEKAGTNEGIKYDDTVYEVTVTVEKNADGTQLVATPVYKVKGGSTKSEIAFSNSTVTPASVVFTAKKTLDGAATATAFEFKLQETDSAFAPISGLTQTKANGAGGVITFDAIEYNAIGNHYYIITEINGGDAGFKYDTKEYHVTVSVTKNSAGTAYVASTTVTLGGAAVTSDAVVFENISLTSVTVKKVWDDNSDSAGLRPASVEVELYKNGAATGTKKTLNAGNSWTASFDDLDKYAGSTTPISYTVVENAVPTGYTVAITGTAETGYIVTNSHTPGLVSIPVTKVWDDATNQDGVRPASVTVHLYANGTEVDSVVLNDSNTWQHTFADKPELSGGVAITYTVKEDAVTGYTATTTGTQTIGYTITNTHVPAKTSISVSKVWDDAGNQDGIRPASVTVRLYANGTEVDSVVLNDSNTWKHTFADKPELSGGVAITYTVAEDAVTNYTTSITGTQTEGYTITNTHVPAKTSISVSKAWDDAGNQDGIRPASVTVRLYANGTEVDSVVLNDSNTWKHTFADKPELSGGATITYTVAEDTVSGYTSAISGNKTEGYTITNTHEPAKTSISVSKAWDDAGDQDGIRPASVTVRLYANGTEVDSVVLNDSNSWKHTFADKPELSGGATITYTVAEDTVSGYTPAISGNKTEGYTITNTHEPAKTSISVSKVWDDETNRDGIRPASVTVRLYANGTEVDSVVLNDSNTWQHTFAEKPELSGGVAITYTVAEDAVTNYTTSITGTQTTGYTITNKHVPATTSVSVKKVWNDNSDSAGLRPTSVEVELYKNGVATGTKKTLDAGNSWTASFDDLDKYAESTTPIAYTVVENDVPTGYTVAITGTAVTGYTVTNSHTPGLVSIPVTKVWDDATNQDGVRPASVTVRLYANGTEVDSVVLNDSNTWQHTFANKPELSGGATITYTVGEDIVSGYTSAISGNKTEGYTITNTHETAKTSVKVTKFWNDSDDQDGIRPASVTVHLYANGTEVDSVVLNDSNTWQHTFADKPELSGGATVTYTVGEDTVSGYTPTITGDQTTGYTITNKHEPAKTSVSVTKVWDDETNRDGIRPASVEVELYKNGVATGTKKTLDASNSWTANFDELDKYAGSTTPVEYTVVETAVTGYTPTITGDQTIGYTITNKHVPEKTSVSVTKVWNDNSDSAGLRPASVEVELYKNGAATGNKKILNAGNSWTASFDELDKYAGSTTPIAYTVVENAVPTGYTVAITGTAETGYIVTNSHTPGLVSIPVTKVWDDMANRDGVRPASVTVRLYANGTEVDSAVLNDSNSWQYTFANKPGFSGGLAITYTVAEDTVSGYTTSITGDQTTGYSITNTHTPATVDLDVKKVWNDNSDADGIRPASVTVELLADGVVIDTQVLNEANSWYCTFVHLPEKSAGVNIVYTVNELTVPGYTAVITGDAASGYVITNTHTPTSSTTPSVIPPVPPTDVVNEESDTSQIGTSPKTADPMGAAAAVAVLSGSLAAFGYRKSRRKEEE